MTQKQHKQHDPGCEKIQLSTNACNVYTKQSTHAARPWSIFIGLNTSIERRWDFAPNIYRGFNNSRYACINISSSSANVGCLSVALCSLVRCKYVSFTWRQLKSVIFAAIERWIWIDDKQILCAYFGGKKNNECFLRCGNSGCLSSWSPEFGTEKSFRSITGNYTACRRLIAAGLVFPILSWVTLSLCCCFAAYSSDCNVFFCSEKRSLRVLVSKRKKIEADEFLWMTFSICANCHARNNEASVDRHEIELFWCGRDGFSSFFILLRALDWETEERLKSRAMFLWCTFASRVRRCCSISTFKVFIISKR